MTKNHDENLNIFRMGCNFLMIFCNANKNINRNILTLLCLASLHVQIATTRYYTLFARFPVCYEVGT